LINQVSTFAKGLRVSRVATFLCGAADIGSERIADQ
jgi:hypothetical protein